MANDLYKGGREDINESREMMMHGEEKHIHERRLPIKMTGHSFMTFLARLRLRCLRSLVLFLFVTE